MDPNLWKAHALLNRLKSQRLRNEKQEISIVYSGNLKISFSSTLSGSLGGIARHGTIIQNLRSQFPVILPLRPVT